MNDLFSYIKYIVILYMRLNIEQKKEVINCYNNNESKNDIIKKFNISISTLNRIIKNLSNNKSFY